MARIALSTSCGAPDRSLPDLVSSFAALNVGAVALHRPPGSGELSALVPMARRIFFVAVFGDRAWSGAPLLVVEGGRAPDDGVERERALEELCRKLHALRAPALAIRTPLDPHAFPAPFELQHLRDALPRLGYWHDVSRGGEEFLAAAGAAIAGASINPLGNPLGEPDFAGLRDVLGARMPVVVALAPGAERDLIVEALACARGVFGA